MVQNFRGILNLLIKIFADEKLITRTFLKSNLTHHILNLKKRIFDSFLTQNPFLFILSLANLPLYTRCCWIGSIFPPRPIWSLFRDLLLFGLAIRFFAFLLSHSVFFVFWSFMWKFCFFLFATHNFSCMPRFLIMQILFVVRVWLKNGNIWFCHVLFLVFNYTSISGATNF